MIAVVCCYKSGGSYDVNYLDYIYRLRDSIKKNLIIDHDFICLSDIEIPEVKNIKLITKFTKYACKFELFRPGLFNKYERVIYFDLDTIINYDIDMLCYIPTEFAMIRDLYFQDKYASGVIVFTPELHLWDKIIRLPEDYCDRVDPLFNKWIDNIDCLNDYIKITSYMSNCEQGAITCFHGDNKPHLNNWKLPDIDYKKHCLIERQYCNDITVLDINAKLINGLTLGVGRSDTKISFLNKDYVVTPKKGSKYINCCPVSGLSLNCNRIYHNESYRLAAINLAYHLTSGDINFYYSRDLNEKEIDNLITLKKQIEAKGRFLKWKRV